MFAIVIAIPLVLIASAAFGMDSSPHTAAPADRAFACDRGSFVKTLTRAKLVAAFGKTNVTEEVIPEGDGGKQTILFAKKPDDRVEIFWQDQTRDASPNAIGIVDRSVWRGPFGLHIGETLADIEKVNGRPFTLLGFRGEGGGGSVDWRGGALATVLHGCGLDLTFASSSEGAAASDQVFVSNSAAMQAAKPVVVGITLNFIRKR